MFYRCQEELQLHTSFQTSCARQQNSSNNNINPCKYNNAQKSFENMAKFKELEQIKITFTKTFRGNSDQEMRKLLL
jgi:hypothetical protein